MRFTKMQGLGNDYVYINCFEENVQDPSALSIRVSNRHFGIGSDGLVLIKPCETADFEMKMYNADGSEAEMCGNASRCIGKYVYDRGLCRKTEITLKTGAGIKRLIIRDENGKFLWIAEAKDCTEEEFKVKELFAGVLVFDSKELFRLLPQIGTNNAQHEYYLTEIPELMKNLGMKVETYMDDDGDDIRGGNTMEDLRKCEEIMRKRGMDRQ